MDLVIIDYGSGNLRSAAKAFEKAMSDAGIRGRVRVSADPADVSAADRIVLPGVGAFADCRRGLDAIPGMVAALEASVIDAARPFMGICVGMQLMATQGFEHGECAGLDWVGGAVREIDAPGQRIPHMGWNTLIPTRSHPLLDGLPADADVYFVHSYAMCADDPARVIAHTQYGGAIAAVIGRDNLVGTQFHPEKSQQAGQVLLQNFLRWAP